MKNKLFWPIIIIAIIIMVESVMLLSDNQTLRSKLDSKVVEMVPTEEMKEEDAFSFEWLTEPGKATLMLTANREVAIDAIDLYIAYKNTKVNSVKNSGDLPKPSFSKISTEKSLVVMNYLISEPEGYKMILGQGVKVVELAISSNSAEAAEFSIDAKTQVVENGSSKVLPFNSKKLIVNSTL